VSEHFSFNVDMSSYPSTSSGRTERELSAAFTAEFIEASGRTGLEQSRVELSAAFTAELDEASGRTEYV
jgi:hypothetical protein